MLVSVAGRLDTQLNYSQVGLGEMKSKLLSSCIASILATIAILFMSPLDNGKSGWGKRLTGIPWVSCLTYLMVKLKSLLSEHSQTTDHRSWISVGSYLWPFLFFQAKCTTRYNNSSTAYQVDCPSLLSFRHIPERCNSAVASNFRASIFISSAELLVNQAQNFSSSVNKL